MIFSFENEICFLSSILMISEGSCDSEDLSNVLKIQLYITEIKYI